MKTLQGILSILAAGSAILGLMGAASTHTPSRAPQSPPPKRILSLAPSITEILYGLGALDRIVGRTDFCDYPPQVKTVSNVGGWYNPNLERMISLTPDLAILMQAQDLTLINKLNDLHIQTLTVPMETVADIRQAITDIGAAIGASHAARRLNKDIDDTLAKIRKQAAALPHPRVLFVLSRTPGSLQGIFVPGKGTYLDDMLDVVGAINVVHDRVKGYASISAESVIALDPQIIIEMHESSSKQADPMQDWSALPSLEAVKNRQIFTVSDEVLLRPSQRVTVSVKLLFDLLHPKAALP